MEPLGITVCVGDVSKGKKGRSLALGCEFRD